jgi:hypothetical protein
VIPDFLERSYQIPNCSQYRIVLAVFWQVPIKVEESRFSGVGYLRVNIQTKAGNNGNDFSCIKIFCIVNTLI